MAANKSRKRDVAKGSRNQQTARAGEYYVAAELNRRGAYAVTFAGNMPKIDILASNTDQSRTVKIQIKTRKVGTWQCSIEDGRPMKMEDEEDKFWIFVDLSKDKAQPVYYIVPDSWIKNDIHETHKAYLEKKFGSRPATIESKHHAVDAKRLHKWEGKWELLNIF